MTPLIQLQSFVVGNWRSWPECGVPENTHTHLEQVIGISKEEGFSNAKIFKRKYETKLDFPEGWGLKPKKPSLGGVWIFSGTTLFQFLPSLMVFTCPWWIRARNLERFLEIKTSKQNCYTDVTCIKLNALEVDKAQTFKFYSGNLVRVFIWEKPVFFFFFFWLLRSWLQELRSW